MWDQSGWIGLFAVMAMVGVGWGCGDEGMDGPERFEFEDIRHLSLDVDHGNVLVFATQRAERGAVVERWSTAESDFEVRQESSDEGALSIEARCNGGAQCRVRYEVILSPRATVDVHVGEGELTIVRTENTINASIARGDLSARNIYSRVSDFHVGQGHLTVQYPELPGKLEMILGDSSSALVEIPRGPYRCYFDQRSEAVEMGDLLCETGVIPAIVIDPRDASVRFEVHDDE